MSKKAAPGARSSSRCEALARHEEAGVERMHALLAIDRLDDERRRRAAQGRGSRNAFAAAAKRAGASTIG